MFSVLLLFGMYVIGYFYHLRFKGIITDSNRLTFSAFDIELNRRHDLDEIAKLHYGRNLYKIFIFTFYIIFPLLVCIMLWNDHLDNM
jgi:hypothetical protein